MQMKDYSESANHADCPEGSTSWCSYNRDSATGQLTHKPIKNSLSEAIVNVMQPLFNWLGSKNF